MKMYDTLASIFLKSKRMTQKFVVLKKLCTAMTHGLMKSIDRWAKINDRSTNI